IYENQPQFACLVCCSRRHYRPFPGGCVKPISNLALSHGHGATCRRFVVALSSWFNPVSLARKRISRKRHPLAALTTVEIEPVDPGTQYPQTTQTLQQEDLVRLCLLRVTHGRHDPIRTPLWCLDLGQSTQSLSWSNFNQESVGILQ